MKAGLVFLILLSINGHSFELLYIQSVSNSRLSFVTRTGKELGLEKDMQATFTTKNVSIVAQVTAINRRFAVWEVVDKTVRVPFEKNQIVEYNRSLDSLYTNLQKRKKLDAPEVVEHLKTRAFMAKANYATPVSQSVSSETGDTITRQANHFELFYQFFWKNNFHIGLGARWDFESTTGGSSDTTTNRFLGLVDFAFHFKRFEDLKANPYIALGGGIGQSVTESSDLTSTGTTYVLPYLRSGLQFHFKKSHFKLLFEGAIESLHSSEEFNSGETTTTDLVNFKLAAGLKYIF